MLRSGPCAIQALFDAWALRFDVRRTATITGLLSVCSPRSCSGVTLDRGPALPLLTAGELLPSADGVRARGAPRRT